MKKSFNLLLVAIMMIAYAQASFAHDPKEHDQDKQHETAQGSTAQASDTMEMEALHDQEQKEEHSAIVQASYGDFPTLHPLIVHFPIVLLLLAFATQLGALFFWKKELSLITALLLLGGLLSAYLASTVFHPHTGELSEAAQQVLDLHDRYADYTLWASGLGFLTKIASHFLLKRTLWMEIIVAAILAVATWSVSSAGHYGATLVHLHGVGPQGNHLEVQDDHEH